MNTYPLSPDSLKHRATMPQLFALSLAPTFHHPNLCLKLEAYKCAEKIKNFWNFNLKLLISHLPLFRSSCFAALFFRFWSQSFRSQSSKICSSKMITFFRKSFRNSAIKSLPALNPWCSKCFRDRCETAESFALPKDVCNFDIADDGTVSGELVWIPYFQNKQN